MSHTPLLLNQPTPGLVLSVFLIIVTLVLSIAAVIVRLATRMVAGFFPAWGWTTTAILCSSIISFIGKSSYGLMLASATTPDPMSWLLVLALGYFLQSIVYKVLLRGSGGEEISLPQALLIGLVQAFIVIGFVIAVGIVIGVFFGVFFGVSGLKQLQTLQHYQPSYVLTARSTPAPAPATIADAQKEAVRRYPLLGVNGSRMNKAYVDRYRLYQKTNPAYFSDPSWPLQLANEVANAPSVR
jgi:hypothetical protein